MEYRRLKGTTLDVSRVCLGTMTFGDQMNEMAGIDAVHAALDLGVNFLDTANVYTKGESEKIVGKAIKGKRSEVVLASKVGFPTSDQPKDRGLGKKHILKAVDETLQRLQTDYLDFYYMHAPDVDTSLEETIEAMKYVVESGKACHIGVSNFPAWKMVDLYHLSGKKLPQVTQNVYNLLTRGIEEELIPSIQNRNTGLVVYNPLAGGLLTGKHSMEKPLDNTRFSDLGGYYARYWNEENFQAIESLKKIGEEMGIPLVELSLRWCLSNEEVYSIILGISSLRHLESNIQACNQGSLPEDVLSKCDEIWNSLKGNRFSYHR
ncbi:aldo/keto reductase [Alkalibacter rhizosphaerae]|uniref:Aldo/keto reductase n=1 Tax=Alkalibacter rhizosphaerae TaxID=2815577 RepID=A0A974XFH8_9FIRM|nr:aldo/keto reductase [Alkalibacter rhizosphaerae]QSX08801.1 aldo/keto reductase [Alkalibacter rhizosphaerae]